MTILFGSFSSVPHTVDTPDGPKELRFSPISAKMLMQLRGVVRPILNALVLFTSSGEADRARELSEATNDQGSTKAAQRKTIVQAVTPEIARLRASQKAEAVSTLVQELLSEAALRTACLVIADSLRVEVKRDQVESTATKMAEEMSVEQIAEYLTGVAKANKKLVGPFLEKLKSVGAIFSMAAERLASEIAPRAEEPSEEPQASDPKTPETVSGESSSSPS